MEQCEQHDYRVPPYPSLGGTDIRVVCCKCGDERVRKFFFERKISRKNDPSTWKKYTQ